MDIKLRSGEYSGEIAWLASSKYQTRVGGITIEKDGVTAVNGKKIVKGGTPLVNVNGLYRPYVAASKVTGDAEGEQNAILWTSKKPGQTVKVALVDPSGNDQPLEISVEGDTITVSLATGNDGSILSTAADVAEAVNADLVASQLVSASVDLEDNDDGSGAVKAVAAAELEGGNGVPEGLLFHYEIDATETDQAAALLVAGDVYEQRLPVPIDEATKAALPRITFLNY